jgi:hypothetical protein
MSDFTQALALLGVSFVLVGLAGGLIWCCMQFSRFYRNIFR